MTNLVPLTRMMDRVTRNGQESDSTRFWELIYAGEFLLKLTTAALVASVSDSKDRDRYALEHMIVHASGIGDWSQAIERAVTGPASKHLNAHVQGIRKEINERDSKDGWRHEAVMKIQEVLRRVHDEKFEIKEKPSIRLWFHLFVQLRNKSRGHGALSPAKLSSCVEDLEKSVCLLVKNLPVSKLEWAYLHRNMSGKYRVVPLSEESSKFDYLKMMETIDSPNLANGIYIWLGKPQLLNLIHSNQDCEDFFFPNGDFKTKDFEIHSLISGDKQRRDNFEFQISPLDRPSSETEGYSELEAIENILTNMPPRPINYISRNNLQDKLENFITNDRDLIVTLVGRGGIGKTSLALETLHQITQKDRFQLIVWFSGRDIDLIESGAKPVKPGILNERDAATFFQSLTGPVKKDKTGENQSPLKFMSDEMSESGFATLFVFDNFETLQNPESFYDWIDTNIRYPNKILITSRSRYFEGDRPITVSGMEIEEATQLVNTTAEKLDIQKLINKEQKNQIISVSECHPYIIKILMGEIANKNHFTNPTNLVTGRDDILNALFERTYSSLHPLAARIFLTLSSWNSSVPQLLIEAALLRNFNEEPGPTGAVDQLVKTSLIERKTDSEDVNHLNVPLSAAIFGKNKLKVAPDHHIINDDVKFLQTLGAAIPGQTKSILPRIERLFKDVAKKIEEKETTLDSARQTLEFIANGYPAAWLLLSEIQREVESEDSLNQAAKYIQNFIQAEPYGFEIHGAWEELKSIYLEQGDAVAACNAFLQAADIKTPPLRPVSSMANWLNSNFSRSKLAVYERTPIFKPLATLFKDVLEENESEATATDYSRLGWLYLNCGETGPAEQAAKAGLSRDPEDQYCSRLNERLNNDQRINGA